MHTRVVLPLALLSTLLPNLLLAFPAVAEDRVLVDAGDVVVTESELTFLLGRVAADIREGVESDPVLRREFVGNVIARKRIALAADEWAGDVGSVDYWALQYKLIDTRDDFVADRYRKDLNIPDLSTVAQEQYYARRDQIAFVPERRRARHILLLCNPMECDRDARREEMIAIAARLDAGEDFAELASEVSEDPGSKGRGGELSTPIEANTEAVDFSFRNAVFDLAAVGDRSPVVESQFGYHLIELTAIEPEHYVPYAQLKPQIMDIVRRQWLAEKVQTYRGSFRPDTEALDIDEAVMADILEGLETR